MIPLSISTAITIRVGHAIGKQRFDRARLVSITGLTLNSSIALVTALLTLIFAENIAEVTRHNESDSDSVPNNNALAEDDQDAVILQCVLKESNSIRIFMRQCCEKQLTNTLKALL